jgi:hypothetical protein
MTDATLGFHEAERLLLSSDDELIGSLKQRMLLSCRNCWVLAELTEIKETSSRVRN